MAFTELTLPVDIPWKRMGVSKDMIDPKAGDLEFPEKWRSSIAAFYHEPTELPPEYCDRKITYIKIVATLTSYQIFGEDVSVLDNLSDSFNEFYAWKNFNNDITRAFPCFGALLQVGVYPKSDDEVPLHDYPYISAFQPRKREMYEVVSESGEMASQSATNINVLKGTMNTRSLENYDLELGGGGGGGHSGLFGLWSHQSDADPQKQVGTINRDQTQTQNVSTTDASREKRESHAFSTSMNQLYSLLQGFHLGTNRAVFFMQPRPHIQDSKFSFIPGLRRLEGVQEFFLIVNRPATIPGLCLEVALETAHSYLQKAYQPRLIRLSDLYVPGNLNKTASALGLSLSSYGYYTRLVSNWNRFFPWVRFLTHEATTGQAGYIPAEINRELNNGSITQQQWSDLKEVTEHLPEIGTEDIALIFEEYEADNGHFFITGRKLCSCVTPSVREEGEDGQVDCESSAEDHISTCSPRPSIVFESTYDGVLRSKTTYKWNKYEASYALNARANALKEALWSSIGSKDRYAYEKTSILETEFALDRMAQVTRLMKSANIRDKDISEVEGLKSFVEKGLGTTTKAKTILDLGTLSTRQIGEDLNLTDKKAKIARSKILKIALSELDVTTIASKTDILNPVQELFSFQYPQDRLEQIEKSSRMVLEGPSVGRQKSGLVRILKQFFGFFLGFGKHRKLYDDFHH